MNDSQGWADELINAPIGCEKPRLKIPPVIRKPPGPWVLAVCERLHYDGEHCYYRVLVDRDVVLPRTIEIRGME